MKSIGFTNFRKFQNFPDTELGNINILVGKNNSGKSTLVKATLLIINYLKSNRHDEFPFSTQLLTDANINSFDRALCHNSIDNIISFDCIISKYKISLKIHGQENRNAGIVDELTIKDTESKISVTNYFSTKTITLSKENTNTESNIHIKESISKEIKTLRNEKDKHLESSITSIELNSKIITLEKKFKTLGKKGNLLKDNSYNLEYSYIDSSFSKFQDITTAINQITNKLMPRGILKYKKKFTKGTKIDIERASKNWVEIILFSNRFSTCLKEKEPYYISAIINKQSELFLVKEKDNSLAQTIHEYKELNISTGETEQLFIKTWMKKFEIGNDFDMQKQTSDAYTVKIIDNKGYSNLADMGLGSLHTMNLLIRIASIIRKNGQKSELNKVECKHVTLILEEPGLCLHPNLQAKLAEFIHFVNHEYKIQFIIETHSEYLIRSSQLIVDNNTYFENNSANTNPFKIYYFNNDGTQYEMEYKKDGKFNKPFGDGFMDVSDEIELKIYLNNLK